MGASLKRKSLLLFKEKHFLVQKQEMQLQFWWLNKWMQLQLWLNFDAKSKAGMQLQLSLNSDPKLTVGMQLQLCLRPCPKSIHISVEVLTKHKGQINIWIAIAVFPLLTCYHMRKCHSNFCIFISYCTIYIPEGNGIDISQLLTSDLRSILVSCSMKKRGYKI